MRTRGPLLFAALALGCVFAGCGPRETAADRAVAEGVLHRSLGAQEPGLDPHLATSLAEGAVLGALFEGLVTPDPRTLEPVPGVAERWEVADDGLAHTFHLRAEARWSNGDPVTAHDFVASIRRALAPSLGAPNAWLLHVLRGARDHVSAPAALGAEAVDARTLRLTLETPTPYFLSLLTHFVWLPVHVGSIRAAGPETDRATRWTTPDRFVGNGPFRLEEVRPEQRITLARQPHYWDAASVRLRGVVFHVFGGVEAEERAYRGGQLHITDALPFGKLPTWRARQPAAVRVAPAYGVYFYRLNVTRPPLDDPRVRRALAAALDRTALTGRLLGGAYEPARAFTPAGPGGYRPPAGLADDPDGARALLAEAGFPGGAGFPRLELLFNTSENHRLLAEAVQEMWRRELGIEVRLANQDARVFLDNRRSLNFDISRASWFGDFADPVSFLEIFTSGNANNQTGWSDPGYDARLTAAARTRDPAERLRLLGEAEAILLEAAPLIPVHVYATIRLVDPRVDGWFDNPLDLHPLKAIGFTNP